MATMAMEIPRGDCNNWSALAPCVSYFKFVDRENTQNLDVTSVAQKVCLTRLQWGISSEHDTA